MEAERESRKTDALPEVAVLGRARTGILLAAVTSVLLAASPAMAAKAPEPLILLHGLWGKVGSWSAYAEHLESTGWTYACVIDLARAGVKLFTVCLSKAADGATLQAMAAATGGGYVHALTAADLQAVFDVVAGGILDDATLPDVAGRAAPGATSRQKFSVDGSVSSLTGSMTWTGSDLDLALASPSGKRYDARSGGVVGGTYESLRGDAPEKGEWQALVKSVDVRMARNSRWDSCPTAKTRDIERTRSAPRGR